ncbi:MAG: carbon starvation protein A [Oscillospiraceae bacterium]|nr:carbon starvation protein A [Oscillospiraceae bacterium]
MSAILILVIAVVVLAIGYVCYGGWLAKQWGVDPNRETPSHSNYDGKDYVPANPAVLMGHHFSSIAGAGPINGPIQAAVFGWVPVLLWVVIGGIFFGGMHDFGALFASIRHGGRSIGEVIGDTMGVRSKRLFIVFALAVLILVIASFTSVVAGTFTSVAPEGEAALPVVTSGLANVSANAATAMTSLLFIVLAFIFGFFVYRKNFPIGPATIIGVLGVIGIVILGLNVGLNFNRTFWVAFVAVYITVASLLPVWMLLQPRDYLSSFLLYGMMILAIVGIFGSNMNVELPAYTGWKLANGNMLFPTLFITVACGACSGFHSLIASGTTGKQLNSERDAKPIGYGAMIIESALAVVALIAVGVVSKQVDVFGGETFTMNAPPTIFAGGIATMVASFAGEKSYSVVYTLLTLAVSVFALTSLDSGTRLARYMFSELFIPEGQKYADVKGVRKFFANPLVGTLFMVIVGCSFGYLQLSQIWGVFGAANQLLAGIAMLAVATWLGEVGKNNKMFYLPMAFMLVATITSLCLTIIAKINLIGANGAMWGDWFQMIWSAVLVILALILVVSAIKTLSKQKKAKA